MKESIIESFGGLGFRFAVQAEQNGTGDAVKSAKAELDGFGGDVIVCCGDMPLMKRDTYIKLAEYHRNGNLDCAILAGTRSSIVDLSSFGRVRVSSDGAFERVTEARDLTAADKDAEASGTMTPLFNSGVYVFKTGSLFAALEELRPANSQREYYLTDAPAIIARQGGAVQVYTHDLGCQIQGVNTMEDLRAAEEYLNNVG
jgi:bifunctional N-acetylglucosamine-1-phosphate-uridyltransferase/glucosamine-1-phosphate-acetyltransferase GlmU-like protein